MKTNGLNELRETFLNFFETKQHLKLKSFSLIPENDASLLLINSGMAPMKQYFLGKEEPPQKRVTTCQKCIRTPDIENVGKTSRHGTFFEMLGNFSFGDYFKKEAISWAWEFITEILNMPKDKLWISVYEQDDEAYDIWTKEIGVSHDRMVRLGKKDNFWEIGTGPCGPCSEIYFDRGEQYGCGLPNCKAGCDCDRFVEFWNLVFTQFTRDEDGNYNKLANPNIDTGMGLERLAAIMQGVTNLFEVDTIRNILNYVCKIANVQYGKSFKNDVSIRVITDHIRSTTMLIADSVIPSNEGRGYVLRRLLRRAARHGKLLGIDKMFLADVSKVVIEESHKAYPELLEKQEYVEKVINIEEEKFQLTIDQGIDILNEYILELKKQGKKTLEGSKVFKLHDTYGFPLEITKEIAEENGLMIDEDEFKKEMEEQKNRAREALKDKDGLGWDEETIIFNVDQPTVFTGYDRNQDDSRILSILKQNQEVDKAFEGEEVIILLDKTPFYGESGGQVGDMGYIKGEGFKVAIKDCKKTNTGLYMHIGVVEEGEVKKDLKVQSEINNNRRNSIARNHTATHLLHKALKNALGNHINQAGSLVEDNRLRFDFTHFSAISLEDLNKVENEVNEKILENLQVDIKEMPVDEAKKLGAMALFSEKYGDVVRVVSIDDYSKELCGGTHVKNTSQILLFKIISEAGVAAGTRRIEAFTGKTAIEYLNSQEQLLSEVSEVLKSEPKECVKKAKNILMDYKEMQKELDKLKSKLLGNSLDDILKSIKEIKGIKVVTQNIENADIDALRNLSDTIKNKISSGVVVLASKSDDKVNFIVTATKDVIEKGIHSGNIIKEIAKIAGGGGGGRPDMAQAGGKDVTKINDALEFSRKVIEQQIKN